MQKVVWRFLTLCICGGISVSAAAKVWLLPDYQERALYSSRTNNKDQPHYETSCLNYGMYAASQIPAGKTCAKSVTIKNLKCYGNCACRPEYQYTSSACRSAGKVASGSSCDGKYTECICDTSQYPHTSSSCAYTLSGSPCSDKYGVHYPKCVNPCEGLSDHDCGKYGCKQTYDACSSKCEVCYTDNCHNRTDNETDYGCEKYWIDCPTKCEVGKTCVPNSCSGYTLDKKPSEGSNYDECRPGCGDTTVKYKLYGCEEAYGFKLNSSGTDCEIAPCTEGTATTVSGCGTISNGSWTLDSLVIGSSGYEPCHMCVAACNAGYANSTSACGTKPEHGYWSLSGSGSCRKCTLKCDSGYSASNGKCVQTCTPNDCSNYTITENQLDEKTTVYTSCTPGCGDTKPRYKVLSCNSGYVTSISSCGRNPTNGSWTLSGSGACKKCTVSCNSGYINSGNSCEPSNVCESRAKELGIPNYPMGQGTGGAPTQANFFSTMSCPCSGSANYCSVSSSTHCVNLTTTYGSKTYNCALMLPSGANNGQCKGYNTMMATSVRTLEELANRISSMRVLYMSMEAGGVASANGTATGRICLETQ